MVLVVLNKRELICSHGRAWEYAVPDTGSAPTNHRPAPARSASVPTCRPRMRTGAVWIRSTAEQIMQHVSSSGSYSYRLWLQCPTKATLSFVFSRFGACNFDSFFYCSGWRRCRNEKSSKALGQPAPGGMLHTDTGIAGGLSVSPSATSLSISICRS